PRRPRAPGLLTGALDRDRAGDQPPRHEPCHRMRPGQGARGHHEAHHEGSGRQLGPRCRDPGTIDRCGEGLSMSFSLEGQIALVTGASRGIGRAVALELGRLGATVVGTATSEAGAADIDKAIADAGLKGAGMMLNVTDAAACEALVAEVEKRFGVVGILVNNAGITRDNLAMRMKDEEWDAVVDTNLRAVFRMSKLVMRGMMKARAGRIIDITSVVASSGNPGQAN